MLDYLKSWQVWLVFIFFVLIIIALYLHVTGQAYKPGDSRKGLSQSTSQSVGTSQSLIKSSRYATPTSSINHEPALTAIPHENWVVTTFKGTPQDLMQCDDAASKNKKLSKGEVACQAAIKDIFGTQPEIQVRLKELTNPVTQTFRVGLST